jgi:NAD(P)-dependent dehydrogenase (short-subunit alcohol dehydrogenase family)
MGGVAGPFAGRVVVVTGAGGGIGRALCVGFSGDDATVVGVGHRESTLAETVAQCPGPMTFVRADLSQPEECLRAMEEIITTHGRIDVLVNNAGVAGSGGFLGTSFETWVHTIELNVVGVAACSRAVLPQMIRNESGRIITLASRAAGAPAIGLSAYCASKAAVSALTRCLAAEISSRHPNVLINDLVPGPTKSGMAPSGQEPAAVYPFARDLALMPAGSASGKVFFEGETIDLFAER